jgi:glucan biosynthesis protein C
MPPVTTATSPSVPVRPGLAPEGTVRYHTLDNLRAAMMLLGIVLHAGLSYTHMPRNSIWPFKDASSSVFCDAIMMASGLFRMPVFFMVAGFFAALIHQRRGGRSLLANRARGSSFPSSSAGW